MRTTYVLRIRIQRTVDFRCVEKFRAAFCVYVMIFIARSKLKHMHFHDTQHEISQRSRNLLYMYIQRRKSVGYLRTLAA